MPKIIDHNQYRKKLLQGCHHLFAKHGYGSLTMRQIASELGVSTGTLYHYFSSKEDIFIQLSEQISEQNIQNSSRYMNPKETLEERLDEFLAFLKSYEGQMIQTFLILVDYNRTERKNDHLAYTNYKLELDRHVQWVSDYLKVEDQDLVRNLIVFFQGVVVHRWLEGREVEIQDEILMMKEMFLYYNQKRKNK